MSTFSPIKINQLLQKLPSGSLFFSSWMRENGISYELQRRYRDSEWLTSLGAGVMVRTGENPTIYEALSSLNKQTVYRILISAPNKSAGNPGKPVSWHDRYSFYL